LLQLQHTAVPARAPRRLFTRRAAVILAAALTLGAGTALAAQLLRTEHTEQLGLFDASGQLGAGVSVAAEREGSCFNNSLAAPGPDAWRCSAGDEILDPCFQPPRGGGPLACMTDPWSPVTKLRLTQPLPKPVSPGSAAPLPWAVETADGQRCTMITGTAEVIAAKRTNYSCNDGSTLVGTIDRSEDVWTILRRPSGDARHGALERVRLRRAYRS
jgi:hypothetical protein